MKGQRLAFRSIKWTKRAISQYQVLKDRAEKRAPAGKSKKTRSSKDAGLFKQVVKTLKHLQENPRHPGLQTHPYRSLPHPYKQGEKVFEAEAYAQHETPGAYRVFWCYGPGEREITIIAITPHP
ncbi:MAG: hypothetical protein ABSG86_11185 [Thermoguttaceae bacterium]|jgi:hypothetical protein